MEDLKLVEAVNDLRRDVRSEVSELRREVRQEMRDVRQQAIDAHLGLLKKLVWAVVVLGLALGGKDLLSLALSVLP
jgi:hypothetical protein